MKFDKPIALAADHGGYELKEAIKAHLDELGVAYTDFGTDSTASVDYPDFDAKGCKGALHMNCVKCGKTFHMADSNAALFAKHLAQSEQFTLDAADTILYGTCSDCKEK